MTPHQRINHPDGAVSVRVDPGGRWKVLRGPENGRHLYGCDAARFCDDQNRFILESHREAVRGYLGAGKAA